ncbi:KH domain-containing protein [Pediococcus siamensis]|uniref:KH domain-containing protein n=1 Tax=Pediococcus siamensis TaxID=381829 RepID=UPI0039A220A2
MKDVETLILTIVKPLVSHPERVSIVQSESERFFEFHLSVAAEDVGRIIGRHGRVAQAIRNVVYSFRFHGEKRIRLVIEDGKSKNS